MNPPLKSLFVTVLLISLTLLFITSCSTKINASETYERGGLLYRIGDDEPFTGIVQGKAQHEGYRRKPCRFVKEYRKGRLHGRSFFYFLSGKVESIEPYENGVINGVVTRYYENGQLKARLHFVDGLRGGSKGEMFWNEDGTRSRG